MVLYCIVLNARYGTVPVQTFERSQNIIFFYQNYDCPYANKAFNIDNLCQWYGTVRYRTIRLWFEIVRSYDTVLMSTTLLIKLNNSNFGKNKVTINLKYILLIIFLINNKYME